MSWWMGAGLGFLRGGPLGAVVGGTIEYFLDKKFQKTIQERLPGIAHQGEFITCLVVILTRVSMKMGPLSPNKVKVIHNFFMKNLNYGPSDLKLLDRLMTEVQNKKPNIERFVADYKKSCRGNYNLLLLALCYQIALVENTLNEGAESLIKIIGSVLGVSYEKHNEIRLKYSLQPFKTLYQILELSPKASNEDIKKAYRKMASQYHPDRVPQDDEKIVEEAHHKFLEIQSAYEKLGKLRNF
jgi:DnaJ like chaperone protein